MAVRVASYNIQYGKGLDGRVDLERIADAVRDADIIALQEVTRGFPVNGGIDMVAQFQALFAERFAAYHPAADSDLGSMVQDGVAFSRRFQFGNMIVSRWPILSARGHLLPRTHRTDALNLQRGALEAIVETPAGLVRIYSVHLDHIDPEERLSQIDALKKLVDAAGRTGAAVSGVGDFGFPEPALASDCLVMGDFNMEPGSAEYRAMTSGADGLHDVSTGDGGWTWTDPHGTKDNQRLDYIFANPGLVSRCYDFCVDRAATGADHMPLFVTVDA